MSNCDSVHQMTNFLVDLIGRGYERCHVLAKNRAKPSAHAMECDPQRAATHPEVVRDLFVQIGRIAGQERRERFEVTEVVALDVFLAKGAQCGIEQRERATL